MRYSTGLILILFFASAAAVTLKDPVQLSGYRRVQDPNRPTLSKLVLERLGLRRDPWGRNPWRYPETIPSNEDHLSGDASDESVWKSPSVHVDGKAVGGKPDPWRREPTIERRNSHWLCED